ncbi:MAG: hypothetical protein ACFFBD_12050 [Candidatus Hodarchaeota archaeon]
MKFIKVYGENRRVKSANYGRIFALLLLKARSPESGLDQQQIKMALTEYIEKISVSTVSRTLADMEKSKLCKSEEETIYKARKKYYIERSLKRFSLEKMDRLKEDTVDFMEKIHKIKENISVEESKEIENQRLLERIMEVNCTLQTELEIIERLIKETGIRLKESTNSR